MEGIEMEEVKHWSDCAVHNAPELEPGPCDCGGYTPGQNAPPSPVSITLERSLDALLNRQKKEG